MSNLSEYDIGDAPRLTNTFLVGDTPTDPTTVSLIVTDPAGVTSTYTYAGATITKSSTGVYYKDLPLTMAGEWHWRYVGTGSVETAAQGRFAVRRTGA